jgi:hypothetical protein
MQKTASNFTFEAKKRIFMSKMAPKVNFSGSIYLAKPFIVELSKSWFSR